MYLLGLTPCDESSRCRGGLTTQHITVTTFQKHNKNKNESKYK